ncbi:MAG: rhodanese-like domain-containing protein [Bacteroidales bacterium]|nr:rhodanese-like domain-containing protein [Bacteroidales bacterium]
MIRLVILFMFISLQLGSQNVIQVISTDVDALKKSNKNLIVLDVRTPGEFSSGHLKDAINIDLRDPEAMEKIKKLDHNDTYLVYCRTKNRSGVVVEFMVKEGFKTVYQMTDGIVGWSQNGLPLEK